jgi:hypothetical protein
MRNRTATDGEVEVTPEIGAWPKGPQCQKKPPRSAVSVGSINWASGAPGLSWPEEYLLAANSARTHWILWGRADPGDYGDAPPCVPLAWCRRRGVERKTAARELLRAYWTSSAGRGSDMFEQFLGAGRVLPHAELEEIAYSAWPDEQPPPDLPAGLVDCHIRDRTAGTVEERCRCFFWSNGMAVEILDWCGRPAARLWNPLAERDDDGETSCTARDGLGHLLELRPLH